MSTDEGDLEEESLALMQATEDDYGDQNEEEEDEDDDDDEEEEDDDEDDEEVGEEEETPPPIAMHLASLLGIRTRERGETGLAARFARLPLPPHPLEHDELSFELANLTRGDAKRQKFSWPFQRDESLTKSNLPGLMDISGDPLVSPSLPSSSCKAQKIAKASSAGPMTRSKKKVDGIKYDNTSLAVDLQDETSLPTHPFAPEPLPIGLLLEKRETATNGRLSGHFGFNASQQRHIQCLSKSPIQGAADDEEEGSGGRSKRWMNSQPVSRNSQGIGRPHPPPPPSSSGGVKTTSSCSEDTSTTHLRNVLGPLHPGSSHLVDSLEARAYIGQYSKDGSFYIAAFQDERVRLYDVTRGWVLRKDVRTRMCRWTVTDTCLSPDQRFLVYSSMHPIVNLVAVGRTDDEVDGVVESISNITQVHESLNFSQWQETDVGRSHEARHPNREFGIFSVKWSGDGREIIAGTSDENVYVFDVETSRVVAFASGHEDDVNSVAYLEAESPFVFASASDDSYIKVWDRRIIDSSCRCKCVGVFVGHTEGLSHIDSRGDGRYLLSNCKDQSAKIWDMRRSLVSEAEENAQPNIPPVPRFRWDYRWMTYPGAGFAICHPRDRSIATFRGHDVRQTLIRAHWSPAFSTGQRYIYSGGADGVVRIWDVLSGEVVREMKQHRSLVRDCSWDPHLPHITSVSWDGTVVQTRL